MYKDNFISALITAAGTGQRMKAKVPKLEIELLNKPIINYTVEKFVDLKIFDEIILVTNEGLLEEYKDRFLGYKNLKVILGGESREESTYNGLKSLNKNSNIVVCHDGARPFVSEETIISSIESSLKFGSGIAGVKAKDTIKLVEENIVHVTLNRDHLYHIQTPQTFKTSLIKKAYNENFGKIQVTDDSSFLEFIDAKVYIVEGSYDNIKITTKEDLVFAKMLMEEIWE